MCVRVPMFPLTLSFSFSSHNDVCACVCLSVCLYICVNIDVVCNTNPSGKILGNCGIVMTIMYNCAISHDFREKIFETKRLHLLVRFLVCGYVYV